MILNRDNIVFSYRDSDFPEGSVVLSVNIVLKKESPVEVKKRTKKYLERKKTSQPLGEFSAGCVFKNPAGEAAGKLIDDAGCKGMTEGAVEVSRIHANYFINRGNATCSDFTVLMDSVKAKVKESSGIELEPEVRIIHG